jgi:hypothetical protein
LRLSVLRSFGPSVMPQKNLVETMYFRRGQASFFSASPISSSLLPAAYTCALSKKLTPASHAAAMHSRAAPPSSWLPYVTHEPNDSSLTFSPERPSLR